IGVGNLNLVNTTTATAVDTLVKNISYKGHSQFQKVNAGTAQKFQLYATGSTTKVGTEITGVTISANRIYTLYARGRNGAVAPYVPALSSMVTR
ncbi:MAG: hypothetical protein JWQ96_2537, partial [Segetibacter sp.]|nr:hypothetical protein [Segetibacter sp.]